MSRAETEQNQSPSKSKPQNSKEAFFTRWNNALSARTGLHRSPSHDSLPSLSSDSSDSGSPRRSHDTTFEVVVAPTGTPAPSQNDTPANPRASYETDAIEVVVVPSDTPVHSSNRSAQARTRQAKADVENPTRSGRSILSSELYAPPIYPDLERGEGGIAATTAEAAAGAATSFAPSR